MIRGGLFSHKKGCEQVSKEEAAREKALSTFIKLENQYELLDFKNCNELVVFAAINSFCRSHGYYSGGYTYLSKHFPMSKNTVIRTIKSLVEKNYIIETPGKYDKTNQYKVNIELITSIINRSTQNGYTQIEYTQDGYGVYPNWVDGIPILGTSKNIVRIDSKNKEEVVVEQTSTASSSNSQDDRKQKQSTANRPTVEHEQYDQPEQSEQAETKKKPARSQKAVYEQQFETFWKEYPKKRDKKQAEKAWLKLKPSQELFDKIMQAVQCWKDSDDWQKDGGQFIPYPATWLNNERWNDEAPAPAKEQQADQRGISPEPAKKAHHQKPTLDF